MDLPFAGMEDVEAVDVVRHTWTWRDVYQGDVDAEILDVNYEDMEMEEVEDVGMN